MRDLSLTLNLGSTSDCESNALVQMNGSEWRGKSKTTLQKRTVLHVVATNNCSLSLRFLFGSSLVLCYESVLVAIE